MVVHIGIYQSTIFQIVYVSSYNSITKYTNVFKIYDVTDDRPVDFGVIFKDILSSIKDELGYACICFEKKFDNNFYKNCIKCGINSGFKEVEILSFYGNKFLHAIFNSNYIPKICDDYIWMPGINGGLTWQKNNKRKFEIEHWLPWNAKTEMKKMKYANDLFKNPKAIFFDSEVDVDEIEAKEIFPNSEIYFCNLYPNMEIPLIKARIMAGDKGFIDYDVVNALDEKIIIWYGEMQIMTFNEFLKLPCEKSVKVVKKDDEMVFKIQKQHSFVEFQLPNFDRFLFTVIFDVNGIYTFSFKELPKLSKTDAEIELLYSKLENKAIAELNPLNFNKTYCIPTNIDLNDDKINAVGIDIGGMHCSAAVDRRNGMEAVGLDNAGERLLPAFVGFDEKHEKCGSIVCQRLKNHPKTSVFGLKQIIGRKFNEITFDETWPFKIVSVENDEIRIQIKTEKNENISKYPEEILAVILKHIKKKAEEFQGKEMGRAVLAIPQNFNEKQRNAIYISALLAEWKSVHLLPEPIAAAFAYFSGENIPMKCNVLVVDLGAESLDITILKVDEGQISVLYNYSNSKINGKKFDLLLNEYFGDKLKTDFGIKFDETKKQKLLLECVKIKTALSVNEETWLAVDEFDISSDENILITRKQFEAMSSNLLLKIQETIKFTLHKGNITELDKLIYVGGGCRMPMVKELLKSMFPNVEHCFQKHPDEVIAIGAAYYSYYLNSSTRNLISATANNSFVFDILQMFIRNRDSAKEIFQPK